MGRKYYDDFSKQPIDTMAQSISDMTYSFENTEIPKKHYKAILEKELMEIAANDANFEMTLLKPYYDMISSMAKENRKYLYKALLMNELKIKYSSLSNQQCHALAIIWEYIEDNKIKTIVDSELISVYEDFINGYDDKKDQTINN